MSETPYLETEALLAVLNDDERKLAQLLLGMTSHELRTLADNARHLSWTCHQVLQAKEETPS